MITLSLSSKAARLAPYRQIDALVPQILSHAGINEAVDVSILVRDDRTLARLNKRYRNISQPTDVLSFPADYQNPETGNRYLGDLAISYQRITAQAAEHGVTEPCEFLLLLTHGLLHLAGYDHDQPGRKASMRRKQSAILAELGCVLQHEVIE